MQTEHRKSKFNELWMDPLKFSNFSSCVVRGPGEFTAKRSLCLVNISVANMGVNALSSHASGIRHKQFIKD